VITRPVRPPAAGHRPAAAARCAQGALNRAGKRGASQGLRPPTRMRP
jgi:hypothetical protein